MTTKTPPDIGIHHVTFPPFGGRLVLVGFGALGNGVLPLLIRHFALTPERICIIDPRGDWADVAASHGIDVLPIALAPENYRETLAPRLRPGDFLLNLSFDVSSLALIDLALESKAFYLDTCLEPWPGGHWDNALPPSERTNYALREKALDLGRCNAGAATAIINCGANPGLVSQLLKQALLDMSAEILSGVAVPTSRAEWAALAKRLDIKVIQVSERDNQQSSSRRKQIGEFVNTWSVDAFVAEGLQPAELGWGTHERLFPADGAQHEFGCGAAIYLNRPGLATSVRSWTPRADTFSGYLVTHGESISIADYLTLHANGTVAYRPTVYYAYHPSDDTVLSVHELAGRNWRLQEARRVAIHEIDSGADEVGVLLMGNARGAYWLGSFLTCAEAGKLAPENNATTLQVNATVIAAMAWALRNPGCGVVEPDDLNYKMILDFARPYLGEISGAWTDWSPLTGRNFPFAEAHLATDDPWQFQNFRCSDGWRDAITIEDSPAQVFIANCELGRGLFASRTFAEGDTILRFAGSLIDFADTVARGDTEGNALQVGLDAYIDLEAPGVFGNHSCEPNAGIRDDQILVALRRISPGEEIRFDYSTTMWEDLGAEWERGGWTMPCRCGAASCRGVVANFSTLPTERQKHYLALGVVQKFIVERLLRARMRYLG